MNIQKLEWDQKYSVGVSIIDDQHKQMFETINLLIESLVGVPKKEQIDEIINRLVAYKKFHFSTEEKYFDEFKYENKEEHIAKHGEFTTKLEQLIAESNGDSAILAFGLIDFLEDWLIDHLMTEDQKYVTCFHDHGLV